MLKDMLVDLKSCNENDWAEYFRQKDIFAARISPADYRDLYRQACLEGEALAEEYAGCTPEKLAEVLKVSVRHNQEDDGQASIVFGCFTEPDQIDIDDLRADEAQMLLDEIDLEFLKGVTIKDILLAHELGHVIQMNHPELMIHQKHVTTFKMGRLERKASLNTLEEAEAMAFARKLLNLDFHPSILDIFLCMPRFANRSKELYNYMMNIRKETL